MVQRATEYLDSLSKESANDPTLDRELAASYEKVGDVQGLPNFANLGDTEGALRSHERALTIRQALAAATPSDPALQRELAITHSHLGNLFHTKKETPTALSHVRRSLAIRQALYDRSPTDEQARRSLAVGHYYLADIASYQEDWAVARDSKERETALFEAILAAKPSDPRAQRDVSIAYKTLGAFSNAAAIARPLSSGTGRRRPSTNVASWPIRWPARRSSTSHSVRPRLAMPCQKLGTSRARSNSMGVR